MDDDEHSVTETEQRLEKILRGAFSGSPTPLKEIPPKAGVSRAPRGERKNSGKKQRRSAPLPLS